MEFGFEPVCDQLRTSFEPASVTEFGFNAVTESAELGSSSRRKGLNAPSLTSPVVNEERTRPGHWLRSAHCFLRCFDTHGWVTGRISGPEKNLCHLKPVGTTRTYGPYARVSKMHPYIRAVNTAHVFTGSVYRALLSIIILWNKPRK